LLQAAVAKEQEALIQNPHLVIVKKDMLKDWIWKALGRFCITYWNGAQRKGYVKAQLFAMQMQWVFDLFLWPNVFYKTLQTLFREDVDRVIDTQNMGTAAILKAIRLFNRKKQKNVVLEKVVVDLPSKAAIHYFRSIKWLSKKDKKILKLKTIAPLLEEGQSFEEFWQTHCGLSDSEIHYEGLNVRHSFRKLQGKERGKDPLALPIRYKNPEELEMIRKCLDAGSIRYLVRDGEIEFSILPEARVFTVLLGSQPSMESTFNYAKTFSQIAKEKKMDLTPIHLFVFCAEHHAGENSLFKKIADFIGKTKNYPKHLSIIPFSFQTDDVIAPLFHRSDMTITRSGGQTAMELMAMNVKEIWVHSEAKKKDGEMTIEELLTGIPGWEAASALYLQKLHGAKIVTPETFAPEVRRLLRSKDAQRPPMSDLESMA
jgi:hypothetical protein